MNLGEEDHKDRVSFSYIISRITTANIAYQGNSLAVQRLGLSASTAGGTGSIPGVGAT